MYRLGHALDLAKPPLLKKLGARLTRISRGRSITVLHPFSTQIGPGESVAILGSNGSGKSTLLSLLVGVLSPSSGTCKIDGEVASILELGSGFNELFTGRNNLKQRAAIYGLSPSQLAESMDDILAFADIGEFIDEPVSTYSTGMRMRLGFALNPVLDPDILIIDEALSVGDAFFQAKCIRWIEDFISRGRIFLCVSHDLGAVMKLCQRGIVLERGRTITEAPIRDAVNTYYSVQRGFGDPSKKKESKPHITTTLMTGVSEGDWEPISLQMTRRTGDQALEITSVSTQPKLEATHHVGDWIKVRIHLRANEDINCHHFGFGFRDKRGILYGGFHSFYLEDESSVEPLKAGEEIALSFDICLNVAPGIYLLLIGASENITETDWIDFDVVWDAAKFTVNGPSRFWGNSEMPHKNFKTEKLVPTET
jgi:ABC-type polysaccharide/polyol phosphate transport system ATPase subunit